jgi:hypothetical protein
MFQKGEGLGVICVDRERCGVYFAQHPDSALQLNQIQSFRFITEHERSLQMFIFLTASLSYAETTDKVSTPRRSKSPRRAIAIAHPLSCNT